MCFGAIPGVHWLATGLCRWPLQKRGTGAVLCPACKTHAAGRCKSVAQAQYCAPRVKPPSRPPPHSPPVENARGDAPWRNWSQFSSLDNSAAWTILQPGQFSSADNSRAWTILQCLANKHFARAERRPRPKINKNQKKHRRG